MGGYYRIMLGRKSCFAEECFREGFIGADFGIREDLTGRLPDQWRPFNKEYIPIFLVNNPGKTRVAAGLACAALWTISKEVQIGDTILSPDGQGSYLIGKVTGDYSYSASGNLPHRRKVDWGNKSILRSSMSDDLKHAAGSIGTVSTVSQYGDEIEGLIQGRPKLLEQASPEEALAVEEARTFAMEKHLEEFLVHNWKQTELGDEYDIYADEDGIQGQQFPTDTGFIDILALSKDRKRLLVVELKRGRASDAVVGQIARYMGYVREELAEEGQQVEGLIIALDDDLRVKRALSSIPGVNFWRYQVNFKLLKA
jgi:restriction system protein